MENSRINVIDVLFLDIIFRLEQCGHIANCTCLDFELFCQKRVLIFDVLRNFHWLTRWLFDIVVTLGPFGQVSFANVRRIAEHKVSIFADGARLNRSEEDDISYMIEDLWQNTT